MAQVDKIFQKVLRDIMDQPWEEQDRAKWSDGTPVKIKRVLHVCNTYDVGREFPLLSLRPVPLVKAVKEVIGIWQKRSVLIRDLGNIWLPWSDNFTSNEIIRVKPVVKEKPLHVDTLIEPLIDGNFEKGKSNNDGYFNIIEDKGSEYVKIQFIDTGYTTTTKRSLIKKGEIKDRYKRSVCGIGYTGNSYAKDIVDFFGDYHRRWISIWSGMINRCYNNSTKEYYKTYKFYKDVFVDKDFHCCETFLRWVMNNMRYDKSYLSVFNIDKDYYASNCYSPKTCTLLTPSENKCLSSKEWFKMDGKYFYSKKDIALYLRYKGYKGIVRISEGKEVAYSKILDPILEELKLKGEIDTFDPNIDNGGGVARFKLNTEKAIPGCYGDMINRTVLLSKSEFEDYQYYDEDYGCYGFYNQTDFILWSLKHDPTSRRILASMFDPVTNNIKPLQECAFQIQLSVKNGVLHMVLYQRSCDTVTAFAWNVAQYAALLMMFAHSSSLKVGTLTHFIGDCHVYDRHEKQAKELLSRTDRIKPIPQVTISSRMEGLGFYDFTADDFEVWSYEPDEQLKFEVAV